jgi:hypothetical protein
MTITTLAQLASSVAVLVAVVFGVLQLRQMAKTRAVLAAAELVRAMQTIEFARSVRLVMSLPDDAPLEVIRADPEAAGAILSLSHVYESLGVMVFHRIVPLHLVDDLMGGYVRKTWQKVAPHVEARRSEYGVFYGEWMQWLAERLHEHPSPGKLSGAHVAHRAWTP